MSDLLSTYTELFVTSDEDDNEVFPHFECSHCPQDVTDTPCPTHAPLTDLPGLRLIECDNTPQHYTWVHSRDDYGTPCPRCLLNDHAARETAARQCRHWAWRRTRAFRWVAGKAYTLGLVAGTGASWGDGHDWCITISRFRGKRSYVLGVSRDTWRCWSKGHRRGDDIGFGLCAKCVPCPDCQSERFDHNTGCPLGETR